jgi:SAM-dependent methyltransferase
MALWAPKAVVPTAITRARITLPQGARVLEIGCGNGAATQLIMQQVNSALLVGNDPSSTFIDRVRETNSRANRGSHSRFSCSVPIIPRGARPARRSPMGSTVSGFTSPTTT